MLQFFFCQDDYYTIGWRSSIARWIKVFVKHEIYSTGFAKMITIL
jgi:hypothetical protein